MTRRAAERRDGRLWLCYWLGQGAAAVLGFPYGSTRKAQRLHSSGTVTHAVSTPTLNRPLLLREHCPLTAEPFAPLRE
jgi:hypothetical protein